MRIFFEILQYIFPRCEYLRCLKSKKHQLSDTMARKAALEGRGRALEEDEARESDLSQRAGEINEASESTDGPVPLSGPVEPPHTAPMQRIPLLICSIGNPGAKYTNTLHSAGHTVLNSLHRTLQSHHLPFTPFQKEKALGGGLASYPISAQGQHLFGSGNTTKGNVNNPIVGGDGAAVAMDWTLWQSTSFMNVSGQGVVQAWKRWKQAISKSESGSPELANASQLVVLHDELEKPLGKVVIKKGKESLKGHNGLKSIHQALGGQPFVRIGVGIGRPTSRAPEDVSRHVLGKMTSVQQKSIEEAAGDVLSMLRELSGD